MLYRSATQVMGGVTGVVDTNKDNVAQWHGAGYGFDKRHLAPYRLTHDGRLFATKATIEGDIKAKSGSIGKIVINENGIGSFGIKGGKYDKEGTDLYLDNDELIFVKTNFREIDYNGVIKYMVEVIKTKITAEGLKTTKEKNIVPVHPYQSVKISNN